MLKLRKEHGSGGWLILERHGKQAVDGSWSILIMSESVVAGGIMKISNGLVKVIENVNVNYGKTILRSDEINIYGLLLA